MIDFSLRYCDSERSENNYHSDLTQAGGGGNPAIAYYFRFWYKPPIMDKDILIGIILTAVALTAVITITVLSRASIERIASDGCRTARETLKGKNNAK